MDCGSSGIPIITDQLEFPFENLPSQTCWQRVSAWLEDRDEETEEVITAQLFLADYESRRDRARRWLEVWAVQRPFERADGWLIPGGAEADWLYEEACHSYVNGMYMAALLCAHASCERVLAGCLNWYEDRLKKGWTMWGLGRLVPTAFDLGLIDEPLKERLLQISELRKVSAHFKPPLTPNSVASRATHLFVQHPELETEEGFDNVLRQDALKALEASTELLRGDQGFARVRGPYDR
jgi:hypothetical protein